MDKIIWLTLSVVTILGSVLLFYAFLTASDEVQFCYIESYLYRINNKTIHTYILSGSLNWAPDIIIDRNESIDELLKTSSKINCIIK